MGAPVWPDALPDYPGPSRRLPRRPRAPRTPFLARVPCDSPRFPEDLVVRLAARLEEDRAEMAMAATREDGELRLQPVFCLMGATVLESLLRFTTSGRRKIDAWTATLRHVSGAVRRRGRVRQRQHDGRAPAAAAAMTRSLPSRRSPRASTATPQALPVAQAQEFIARLVPSVDRRSRCRAALGARPRPRAGRRLADRRAGARQLGDGRLRAARRRARRRRPDEVRWSPAPASRAALRGRGSAPANACAS